VVQENRKEQITRLPIFVYVADYGKITAVPLVTVGVQVPSS